MTFQEKNPRALELRNIVRKRVFNLDSQRSSGLVDWRRPGVALLDTGSHALLRT